MFDLIYHSHAKDLYVPSWCQEVLNACLESMSDSSTQRVEEALYKVPRRIINKQKGKHPKKQDNGKCLLNAMYL